jgi:acyl-coenzyme A thioesterase 9
MVCEPQQRNTAGRIFGGFLMRRAVELAASTAFCFAGARPVCLGSEEIAFKKPVGAEWGAGWV